MWGTTEPQLNSIWGWIFRKVFKGTAGSALKHQKEHTLSAVLNKSAFIYTCACLPAATGTNPVCMHSLCAFSLGWNKTTSLPFSWQPVDKNLVPFHLQGQEQGAYSLQTAEQIGIVENKLL